VEHLVVIVRISGILVDEIDTGLLVVGHRVLDAAAMTGVSAVMILVRDPERPSLLALLAYDQGLVFEVQQMLALGRLWLMKFVFCDVVIRQWAPSVSSLCQIPSLVSSALFSPRLLQQLVQQNWEQRPANSCVLVQLAVVLLQALAGTTFQR
jgi:hypothetical protein